MAEAKKKKGLGRGLSTLLEDVGASAAMATRAAPAASSGSGYRTVPIEKVRPNPDQPRSTFTPAEMDDLTSSISEKGVLQPLLVAPDPENEDGWMIIAGERRWRAAQAAKLHEVPVVVRDASEEEILEIAIIENIQRSDLNAVEEARGYQQLIDKFGHSQAGLAKVLGKSRPHIANSLRLLSLPDEVQNLLEGNRLTAGHARALVTSDDPAGLAKKVIDQGLSVRQTEDLVRRIDKQPMAKPAHRPRKGDADTRALEADLSAALSAKVRIAHKGNGGDLTISYRDLEELDGLCQLLMRQ